VLLREYFLVALVLLCLLVPESGHHSVITTSSAYILSLRPPLLSSSSPCTFPLCDSGDLNHTQRAIQDVDDEVQLAAGDSSGAASPKPLTNVGTCLLLPSTTLTILQTSIHKLRLPMRGFFRYTGRSQQSLSPCHAAQVSRSLTSYAIRNRILRI
jgi:hypothetical protein